MHGAVRSLNQTTMNRVKGAVLYGDTRNEQDHMQIPNYPTENTKIFCNANDGVCNGTLSVTVGHFEYLPSVDPAVAFLQQRITAGGGLLGNGSAARGDGAGLISKFTLAEAKKGSM